MEDKINELQTTMAKTKIHVEAKYNKKCYQTRLTCYKGEKDYMLADFHNMLSTIQSYMELTMLSRLKYK